MLLFGVCFVLYFIKLSAGKGYYHNAQVTLVFLNTFQIQLPFSANLYKNVKF